jgi:hypothetical protein
MPTLPLLFTVNACIDVEGGLPLIGHTALSNAIST